MGETIDKEMFNNTMNARQEDLRTVALEIGNRINLMRLDIQQLENQQKEIVGSMNEIENMKKTFGKKDKKSKDDIEEQT